MEGEVLKDQGVLEVTSRHAPPPRLVVDLVAQAVVDQVKKSIGQKIFPFQKEFYPLPGVELRGGSGPFEGNIWVDGEPVCDDTFTESSHGEVNARVICRYVFLKIRNC